MRTVWVNCYKDDVLSRSYDFATGAIDPFGNMLGFRERLDTQGIE